MEPHIILAQLRALLERMPNFAEYSPTSKEHMTWLAQAHAIVSRWNRTEAYSFQLASDSLMMEFFRDMNVGKLAGILHRAIADLELDVPSDIEVSFGAGDVYDFFNALNKVISTAEETIFIIDPYLDESVFDHYLNSRQKNVSVRLLVNNKAENLIPAYKKYNVQHGDILQIKRSKELHDRIIFIDNYVCWLVGQSLKDAAKAKPTYLVQLPPDVVSEKLSNYEKIWVSANEL